MKNKFLTILFLFAIFLVNANAKEKKIESLTLNQVPVKEAARLIGISTNTPIIVSNDASKILVDIHLENVGIKTAMRSLCQSAGLWYQKDEKDGLLHIMTIDEFKSTLQFDRNEKVEVVQILYPAAKDIGDAIAKLYIDRVIWLDPKDNSGNQYSDISKALKRMDLLGERGTFDITTSNSSNSSNEDEEDDDNDDMESKRKEFEKSSQIDPKQISQNQLRSSFAIGKNENVSTMKIHEFLNVPGRVFMSVLPENNSLMLRSGDAEAIDEILKVVEKLDKPNPQVLLEVKILSVSLNDSKERAIDFLFSSNSGAVSGGFSNGSLNTNGGQDILKPSSYDPSTGAGLVPQGSGINTSAAIFSVVSKNFKARIQLLEQDGRITALATPNILVGNNESTTLFIGSETTVMEKAQSTTTYTEVSSGGFQPNISWEIEAPRRKIGTSLLLTPKIHADKTVTLRLLQERSSLGEQVKNVYSGGSASQGSEELYFISQNIDLQRVVTTVIGNNKDFMVLGGLINEEVGKVEEKIPVLSDIPILGELLFTRMSADRKRSEIIVIIRPFVMLAPGESQMISKSYLERISQHPAAREDLPSLGVNTPNELAKPKVVNHNDPFLLQMFNKIRGWSIDTKDDFNVNEQFRRQDRRENHQKAIEEIERIQKNEK